MAEKELKYVMQLSSKDCTGCGVCASVCPAKEKALVMQDAAELMEKENKNYEFVNSIPNQKSATFKPTTVKGNYVKNISISSTMGPGVKVDLNSFDK
jgi:pyruvate-ferredoxin/flavodoxin oxidoreductase